jgi:outer membrane protein TolC
LQAEELAQALTESWCRAGAEPLLALLNAQSTLYAAQDEALQLKLTHLRAAVSLYKALGGGWQAEDRETANATFFAMTGNSLIKPMEHL